MPDDRTVPLDAADERAADTAISVLMSGGTVIMPTDTVYGVAALPSVAGATEQLFALKERDERQPLAVLVADVEQACELVEDPPGHVERWMAELWPGPLTLVLDRSPLARSLVLGGDDRTIGVRCPDHDLVRAIASEVGPIATTSANRAGQATPTSALAAAASLVGDVDLVIDGGPAGTVASTVVDCSGERWEVLREGAIAADRLR